MDKLFAGQSRPFVPRYAIIPLLCAVVLNCGIYSSTQFLCANRYHYDFTLAFDRAVPVIPQFVIIYLVCYAFWALNYILISRVGKEHFFKFITADYISRLVCAVFFILLPTTNVRPEIVSDSLSTMLLNFVYTVDMPYNLFPSIHCLVSWFCCIGLRGVKSVPKAYRVFSCIFAILICISTQVTKQHYIVDLIGGIFLAELLYFLSHRVGLYRKVMAVFDKLQNRLFKPVNKDASPS